MAYIDLGRMARHGAYCDICKKTIYFNYWGHVEMHRRELQRAEDRRAAREASANFQRKLDGLGGRY